MISTEQLKSIVKEALRSGLTESDISACVADCVKEEKEAGKDEDKMAKAFGLPSFVK